MLEYKKKMLYSRSVNIGGDIMIYPSIDKLLSQVGSKFLLVNIVSKRVHEMEENVSKGLIHIKEKQES